ncbi:MAG TPA: hypothetical protein VES36_10250 [Candidatus Limnocylindrales bacterium]|nr:hypothetical protein [Candidatus Limnocylindrales bacterium]
MASITRFDPFSEMVMLTMRTYNGEASAPALDVHETGDEIIVTAAQPGQYLYRERHYGNFHRQLQLPVRVQGDAARADVKARQIEVKPAPSQAESLDQWPAGRVNSTLRGEAARRRAVDVRRSGNGR